MRENDANITQSFTCPRFRLSDNRPLIAVKGMNRMILDRGRPLEGEALVAADQVAVQA